LDEGLLISVPKQFFPNPKPIPNFKIFTMSKLTTVFLGIFIALFCPIGAFQQIPRYIKRQSWNKIKQPSRPFRKPVDHLDKGVTTRPRSRSSLQAAHSSHLLLGAAALTPQSDSYFLTRIFLLRALGFVYSVAFLVAKHQNKALIGDNGITPARQVLDAAQEKGILIKKQRDGWLNSTVSGKPKDLETKNPIEQLRNTPAVRALGMTINRNPTFQYWRERLWDRCDQLGRPVTSLLWLAEDRSNLNPWLDGISTCGLAMSLTVFVLGAANLPLMFGMWVCQRSLMAVGGPWYGFGWEPQLAELGFHALFLVPLWSFNPLTATCVPSPLVMWTLRWYLFRIMMGAGLIKLKSDDPKWNLDNLSAMDCFYETQPVPNPLTRYFHWAPKWWHKFEVLSNHFVELIAPWLLLLPISRIRRTGGLIQIVFQAILISSGNLSFLNWLTMVPAIACLDDAFLGPFFSSTTQRMASMVGMTAQPSAVRQIVTLLFGLLVATLSIPVVQNLISKKQIMNTGFDPLRLINSYGAFGTVDEDREEFIISAAVDLDSDWKEYEFKVKRGDVMRQPRFISPYHYRLDWQMWIASIIGNIDRSPWMYNFLLKLLERDPDVLDLLKCDPFEGEKEGPKYIRVDKYRYKFHKPERNVKGRQRYWDREMIGRVFPRQGIATVADLKDLVQRTP
jgi:hypothetical protein